jgi:hypothetical protein
MSNNVLVKPLFIIKPPYMATTIADKRHAKRTHVLILLISGKDIGKYGDNREFGKFGRLQRESHQRDGTLGAIDNLAKEHHIDKT